MNPRLIIVSWLVVVAATAVSPTASAATVFDTLGPGNTYEQNSGYTVVNGSPLGLIESAAQFTALASGTLSEIDLGLTTQSNTLHVFPSVNVYLASDALGQPDNLTEILLGTVTPTQFLGTTNNSIVTLNSLSSLNVSVNAGTTYWLVLKPAGNSPLFDAWNLSSPAVPGAQYFSTDDVNWASANSTLAAFEILAVPEPATWAAGVLATMWLVPQFILRRRVAQ